MYSVFVIETPLVLGVAILSTLSLDAVVVSHTVSLMMNMKKLELLLRENSAKRLHKFECAHVIVGMSYCFLVMATAGPEEFDWFEWISRLLYVLMVWLGVTINAQFSALFEELATQFRHLYRNIDEKYVDLTDHTRLASLSQITVDAYKWQIIAYVLSFMTSVIQGADDLITMMLRDFDLVQTCLQFSGLLSQLVQLIMLMHVCQKTKSEVRSEGSQECSKKLTSKL